MTDNSHLVRIRVVDTMGNPITQPGGSVPVFNTQLGLLYGADTAVCAWAYAKLGAPPPVLMPRAIGVIREGVGTDRIEPAKDLIAAAVFFNLQDRADRSDLSVTVVAEDIFAARPHSIKGILLWAFGDLGVRRLTAEIDASNGPSLSNAQKLGFQVEGVKRRAGAHGGDTVVLGLVPDECPLLMDGTQNNVASAA